LRDSKQPHKSVASRSRFDDASDVLIVGLGERVYESSKLAALFDTLTDHGHPGSEILKNVGLRIDEVHSPKARTSLKQLMIACRNAIQLSGDPHLPYRVGTSIHVSTYGMYGFAILCCPDFRKAMDFAARYHALAAPLATIAFNEEKGFGSWTIEPNVQTSTEPHLYRFIAEMQIGIHISLMRDIMGPTFAPHEICLTYPEARDFGLPADQIGCSVRFRSSEKSYSLPVDMAGSIRPPRQQDDLSHHRRLVRQPAWRSQASNWGGRQDPHASAAGHRQPSQLCSHREGSRRQ
jgi:Arabinose-binding domain of AraC transcription regulator, N-term